MSEKVCKVAVIGAGNMAREHIRAFQDIPDVVISGIHSRTWERAEKLAETYGIEHVYDSVDQLYKEAEANLVIIAASIMALRSLSERCFKYPWKIFMEKPPGYNLAEAIQISEEAIKEKRDVFVGLNRRFLSSTQQVLSDLSENPGQRFIHVQDQQDMATAHKHRHPENIIHNWMYANSIHLIDYFTLLGRGVVTSVTPILPWSLEDPTTVIAKIEFSSGDIGIYEGIWHAPGPWSVSVTTAAKRWEMRPLEKASYQPRGSRQSYPLSMHEWDEKFKPGFRLQAENVVNMTIGRESVSPRIEDAIKTMELIAQIYQMSYR